MPTAGSLRSKRIPYRLTTTRWFVGDTRNCSSLPPPLNGVVADQSCEEHRETLTKDQRQLNG
ncbi:hypothetical protein J6590_063921 [Homalodisca vitripennis]|nr:hypothetical protein J6590_063921 [Homalodisca vitripennis]